ncbi:MAG: hypothetical protein H7829_11355 [Magnetococcus sp. THC-1_WYH]
MNEITINQALDALRVKNIYFKYTGRADLVINRPVSISQFDGNHCIAFLRSGSVDPYCTLLTRNSLLIAPLNQYGLDYENNNLIFTQTPEIAFYAIARLLNPKPISYVHLMSVVSPQAIIGESVTIGALAYIGPDVALGDGVVIGEGCIINNASIGKDTILQSGVKIGSAALGGLKDSTGNWHDRPHFGRVCIGSNVRIEDNVVINQGYLKDTIISDQVRIGPLSCIGNGVSLAEGVLLAQSVTIAGSVSVGTNSSVWGNASVRDGVAIGRNSMVGMGSVVLCNIPDYELWVGNPAACKRKL